MSSTKIQNPGECPVVMQKTQAQIRQSIELAEWSLARYPRKQYEELKAELAEKLASDTAANVWYALSWLAFELEKRAATVEIVDRLFADWQTTNPVELAERFEKERLDLEREVLWFARRSSVSSALDRNMAYIAKANAQGDVLEQLQNPHIVELVQALKGYETAPEDEFKAWHRLSAEDQKRYDKWLEQKLAYQAQEQKAQKRREADRAKREAAKAK